MVNDKHYMQMALELACKGLGRTSPNPMVGAVVVLNGDVVGQGWHQQAGTKHAEIHALIAAGEFARGATLYVTLEPCCHYGRTGPCTKAIIKAGISRVVFAMFDPNPVVAGCGAKQLQAAGIMVTSGVLADEAARINEAFIKVITTKMPFVALKMAMTLDGKIATVSGHSQWITSGDAQYRVHQWRDQFDAVMVGIGTVLADNPQLTVRHLTGRNPVRVIVDSMARTPLTAAVLTDKKAPTIVAVSCQAPVERIMTLKSLGAEVICLPSTEDFGLDLDMLFKLLAEKGLIRILVEGGPTLNASIINRNLADQALWFIAPKIIGGAEAPGPVGGSGISLLDDAQMLEDITAEQVGVDLLIKGYFTKREGRDVYRNCGRIGCS